MKIHFHLHHMLSKSMFVLLLNAIYIFFANPIFAQNNIMYVLPKMSPTSTVIASGFEKNIVNKITNVKSKVGYATYTDANEGRKICYNKIRASSINYLLKLDKITEANSVYQLDFSLSKVNDDNAGDRLFEEEDVAWQNSSFLIKRNANVANEIDEILNDLNAEIKYYFENEKFRSRIYIDPQGFEPKEEEFYAAFIDWLENEMGLAENEKHPGYIIYYDNKPYPQNAPYVLYGKFTPEDQKWSAVQFYLIYDSKTQKSRAVRINVEDFEYGEPEHAEQYKKEVMNKIYDLLSRYD